MMLSDSPSRAIRRPAASKAIPAASYSGWYQPAPMPSSNRPPDSRCRLAASCARMAGCRKSLDSTRVPTRSRVVTAAAAARPLNGASCCPNGPAEKWSRSSRASIPPSSTRRAKSSHARPSRTDSLTTPNRTMAMVRFGVVSESVREGRAWLDFARRVEDGGIDALLLRDHFSAGPFGQQLAPFSGLAAAAAVTTRLRVGTLVLSNDFRHPAILAHEAASLHLLSG